MINKTSINCSNNVSAVQVQSGRSEKGYFSSEALINTTTIAALGSLSLYTALEGLPGIGNYVVPALDLIGLAGLLYLNYGSKPNRYEEALNKAKSGDNDLLNTIKQYNLTDEQESVVVSALFKNNPKTYSSFANPGKATPGLCEKVVRNAMLTPGGCLNIVKNLHKYNLSQEQRFQFAMELAKTLPDQVSEGVVNYDLSEGQERDLALMIAKDPSGNISKYIGNFNKLNAGNRKEIANVAVKTHPTKVFEHLSKYGFEDTNFLKEDLKSHFEMQELLSTLKKGGSSHFEKVLACVQQITKKSPLPEIFEKKIRRYIDKKLEATTQKDVIELVAAFNKYPSDITHPMITRIQTKLGDLFPELNTYCYTDRGTTHLKGKGFDFIAKSIKTPSEMHIYETVHVEELNGIVQEFLSSNHKKAAIPVTFNESLTGHFCPVYLEKDEEGKLRVFISDSTGEKSEDNFPQTIIPKFENQPVKDLYVMHAQRQFGVAICSIFSINDIVEIAQHEDIFSALEKEGGVKEAKLGNIPYKQVVDLPVGLMKMTQSLSKVKSYIEQKGNEIMKANSTLVGHEESNLKSFIDNASHFNMDHYGRTRLQNRFGDWGWQKL